MNYLSYNQMWWIMAAAIGFATGLTTPLTYRKLRNWLFAVNPAASALLCCISLVIGKYYGFSTFNETRLCSIFLAAIAALSTTIAFLDN